MLWHLGSMMEPEPTNGPPEPAKARAVLSYFFRHRRAADTLEGVVRWRLLEEQVREDACDEGGHRVAGLETFSKRGCAALLE